MEETLIKMDLIHPIYKLFKAVLLILFTVALTIGMQELETAEINFVFVGVFLLIMEKTFTYLSKFKGIALLGAIFVFIGLLVGDYNFTKLGAIVIAASVVIDIAIVSFNAIDTKKLDKKIRMVIDKCRGYIKKKKKK